MMLLVLTLRVVAFCLVALSVRVLFKKNGTFSHRCAARESGAPCCSSGRHEDCPNFELHHGNTATRMAKAVEMADA